jgi:heme/copper-type cytochrome/quinol oxidase subunit 3
MSVSVTRSSSVPQPRPVGWWGMALFVLAELALFGSALASYYYLRAIAPVWPLGGIEKPDLLVGGIATVVLVSSSVPMWWAERAARDGRTTSVRVGLAAATLLGLAFLVIEAIEWSIAPFGPDTNVYGSLFFTLTGLHGLHLIFGILVAAFMQIRAWRGVADPDAIRTGALYWHAVDAVWIAVFLTVYVSPHVG